MKTKAVENIINMIYDNFKEDFYGEIDTRGYILKLTVSWRIGLQTDGGGYVIIAPEF